jgi:hypothetical protein
MEIAFLIQSPSTYQIDEGEYYKNPEEAFTK